MIDRYMFRIPRVRTGGEDNGAGCDVLAASVNRLHFDGRCVDETGTSVKQGDPVSPKLPAHEGIVSGDDLLQTAEERRDLRVRFEAEVERLAGAFEPVQVQRAFPQRFAENRSSVDATAADAAFLLDERHPFPNLGPLDGCFLASRPGSNHDDIEGDRSTHRFMADTMASTLSLPDKSWSMSSGYRFISANT